MSRVIPLSTATTLALARLQPEHDPRDRRSVDARNVVAVALSALIPIYKRDPHTSALQRMSEEELSAGRFLDGASKFVFDDGRPDVQLLAVRKDEADAAIEEIAMSVMAERYARYPKSRKPRDPAAS